ncbi:regulatory protein GemA [Bergeriella denitrificans]|uniref:regulatory protein GemA n=1 Tax=Bergeriella denitrificans TaxID=494 RepID=UPI001FE4F199|nr:regulatory protein GemA [Bergeriella denitrificans]
MFEPQEDMAGQVKKIRALWLELHRLGAVRNPSELALAKFVKRMTGVDYQGWLDVDNASKVIEHLKKWVLRVVGTV